jgi:hypothetical protein
MGKEEFITGEVYLDTINGVAGTSWPIGTKECPVNNMDDAYVIADRRGLNCIVTVENPVEDPMQELAKRLEELYGKFTK